MSGRVALVHDYLTQRGGAERVVLALTRAFPDAALYTSLYEPSTTFPDFANLDVRPLPLNRLAPLRDRHRLALPLLAPAFSRLHLPEDVVICSSSGWAHGACASGRKIVYCHTPARWLYQPERYLRGHGLAARSTLRILRPALERWDRRAAASADSYLANSSAVAERIRQIYGLESEVLPPPPALEPGGPAERVTGVEPDFLLCVSRLLPYKNLDAVVRAFSRLVDERLVLVGSGPEEPRLRSLAGGNVSLLGAVSDEELRWLYRECSGLIAASHEDFGLTPLEAAGFGHPSAVLRWGGFLDTVEEGGTGLFFDSPTPETVADAVRRLRRHGWDADAIRAHAQRFSEDRFIDRIRTIVGAH
ncbi:MAG TPA: glycosyltransferase [Gaiellaceae bacterium]|nr:glycosyltransferase [Gaiellaceae bacterium]